MKNKGCWRWFFWLGLIGLIAACMGGSALVYFRANTPVVNSRPLVLIHAPINHEQVQSGDGVIVHATARAGNGIHRLELWEDNSFVDARDVTDGSAPALLVFSGTWVATTEGNHKLIVRAISVDGTEGQSSVVVQVLPQAASDSGVYIVGEGETFESIAGEYGVSPEEFAAANPDIGPDGPLPGDELVIPGGEAPPVDDGEPEESSDGGSGSPAPGGDDPGAPGSDFEFPLLEPLRAFVFGEGEPAGLRVEFLGLGTAANYEQLHCYAGYAGVSPLWYPDTDNDQTTDESFEVAGVEPGGVTFWNMETLSGDSMPIFYWPRNRNLPIAISCVGILGGGTEAVELGRWEGDISPDLWTGMPLGGGVAGSYEFAYRITRVGSWGSDMPISPDSDMTPPVNARLDDRRVSLRWDYAPRTGEEEIDGFRIYLNGNLQWVEPANSRESMLPYEWFNPPCGSIYEFGVTAYRRGSPLGDESTQALASLDQPAEDCSREVLVTFLTLETFDLGGDGHHEPRDGDIGPPHGYFFGNERQITFDGGTLEGGGVDSANGFRHNTTYNLLDLSADPTWGFNGMPALVAAIPEGGTFEFGFSIMDEDSGRCHNSDDPGCDDLICDGASSVYAEEHDASLFDEHHEGSIMSENGRCRVTYTWGPAAGSPVGSGEAGQEPLPQINIEAMEVDETSGNVRLHVRNIGTASWPWRDLNVELLSRSGPSLGVFTWTDFILEPGQRTVLEHPDMHLAAPFDACAMVDPFDDVAEELERSAGIPHRPHCPSLPDLVIGNVDYELSGGGRLRVTVHNAGEGTLQNRTLALQSLMADGSRLYLDGSWPGVTLGPYESRTFDLSGVTESAYEQMRAGYSVIVNPDHTIVESNYDNNVFTARQAIRIRFEPLEFFSERAGENQLHCRTEVHFNFSLGHGTNPDNVDWMETRYPQTGHLTYLVDHPICVGEDPGPWVPGNSYISEIEVPPGENLYLHIEGWEEDEGLSDDDLLGEITRVYGPDENFGDGEYGWTESTGGYNDDVEPNGGLGFVARWRITLLTP